jgi:hypothetical protein
MSQFNESFRRTFIAEQAFDVGTGTGSGQYTIVKLKGASASYPNQIIAAAAPTDALIGVLQDNPKSGDAGAVQFLGTTKVRAHTTITAGQKLTAFLETSGVYAGFATANPTTTTGDLVIGIALQDAVVGDVFEMLQIQYKY